VERLPEDLARQALTHASWVAERADAYERLAFLGDSVLGLAVTTHLWPRLAPEATPANDALARTERVLASIIEAVIGACYLEHGYDRTSAGAAARSRSGSPSRSATARHERPETAWARIFVSRPAP